MHYHSPQHGGPRLHGVARPPRGETNLPSSSSLPDTAPQPQNPPAAGASHFDRMEAELKALQQQAQATQQSLQQLQTRTSVDPVSAMASDVPGLASVNSTMLGVGSALVLASVAAWWYLWQRPRTRWIDAPRAPTPREAPPISARVPLSETGGPVLYAPGNSTQPPSAVVHDDALDWDMNSVSGDTTQPYDPASPFARQDPNVSFDSEAAATEVMRVRKSLAEKREARAYLLEREDGPPPAPALDAALDLDLDLDAPPPPSPPTQPPSPPATPAPSATDDALDLALDLDVDPWRQPGETPAGAHDADAIHLSFALEDYGIEPAPPDAMADFTLAENGPALVAPQHNAQPELELVPDMAFDEAIPAPAPELQLQVQTETEPELLPPSPPGHEPAHHAADAKHYDFTITMALAHESAALELWPEARDLATEVLESGDPALVSEALSLLEQLNQQELNAPPDTAWNTVR